MTTAVKGNQLQSELIAKIAIAMTDRQWSQDELARRSGVSQPNISQLLRGERKGTLTTWNKLLRAVEE